MKFAKIVFYIAGVWGVLVLGSLFFLAEFIGKQSPPPITHLEFFYGFALAVFMWQISFFIIARDPARYRSFMIPPAIVKIGYATIVCVCIAQGRLGHEQYLFAGTDYVLAILFFMAFNRTAAATRDHHLRRE